MSINFIRLIVPTSLLDWFYFQYITYMLAFKLMLTSASCADVCGTYERSKKQDETQLDTFCGINRQLYVYNFSFL